MNNYLKNKAFETYMLLVEGHDKSKIDERLKKYIYIYMKRDKLSFDKAIVKAILNMGKLTQCDPSWLVPASTRTIDGGKGSGNFGHKGRPGQVGGSAKAGGGGELLKVSTEPTLVDIDDGLAEAGIKKGDVVKVFGLRKDVLLSHLQNRLKAGKDWKGVLKPEDVAKARAVKQTLIDNGDTASKDFIKVNRTLARYDFINKLAEKFEGIPADEPVKTEEPKVEELKTEKKERVKKEKLVEEPKATAKDLGTVTFTPNFKRGLPDIDVKGMYKTQLFDSESLAKLIKKETGVAFDINDDNISLALESASDLFKAEATALKWDDPYVKTLFNYEMNIAKGTTVNPMKLDSAIKKAGAHMRHHITENSDGYNCFEVIATLLALNEVRKQQNEAGITQAVYDKMEKGSNVVKSKLTDSNNFGKASADAYRESTISYSKKIKNIETAEMGFLKPEWVDKLSAEFSSINVSQYGLDTNDKDTRVLVKAGYTELNLEKVKTVYEYELPSTLNYQDFVDNLQERSGKILNNFKSALEEYKAGKGDRGYTRGAASDFMTVEALLRGLQDYKKIHGEPEQLDSDFRDKCLALGMMHLYATRKEISKNMTPREGLSDFILHSTDAGVLNAFMEYLPKSMGVENGENKTKQTHMAEQLQKASTKPDIENDMINTKISNTKREGNNLNVLQSILKSMNKSGLENYINGGERSKFGFDSRSVTSFTRDLMKGETDLKRIDLNKKYNNKLLSSDEIGNIISAMTVSGDCYVPLKEPNKFGSNNIMNLMVACGEIVDAKDVSCVRYENMDDGYRNYNFKVGDLLTFDSQHASHNLEFADDEGLRWFGDDTPCRFEVVGKYPRLNLEPFVYQGKHAKEFEQLMAGFFKVKKVEDGVLMRTKNRNVGVKKVQVEFDWDRLDEYLSLQARAYADYMGMYGDKKSGK